MSVTPDVLNSAYISKEGGAGHGHSSKQKRSANPLPPTSATKHATKWFVLRDLFLFYYQEQPSPTSQKADNLKGILYVPNLTVKDSNKPGSFIIASKDKEYYIIVDNPNPQDQAEQLGEWRNCFEYVILRAGAMQSKLQTQSGTLSKATKKEKFHYFLRGNLLNYYSDKPAQENDIKKLKGWIDLLTVTSIKTEGLGENEFALVTREGKSHNLIASSADDRVRWVEILNQQIKVLVETKFPTVWTLAAEKLVKVAKFSVSIRNKSASYTVALTSASIRLYKDSQTEESLKTNLAAKDFAGVIPLTLAYATADLKAIHVTDYEGSVFSFSSPDAEQMKQWLELILKSCHSATSAIVKNGGTIKTFAHQVVEGNADQNFAIVSMTGSGITVEVLATKQTISMGTEDFKKADVVDDKPNLVKLEYGSSHVLLRLKNARALALATKAAIEGLRKKKAKTRSKSRTKSSSKPRRGTVTKKKRGKKQIRDHDKARLQELFDKFDTDKSKSIDKQEMRAVIEEAFKTKVSEALIQKYVEVEFAKHDTDNSGSIDFDEFCQLYSRLYLDPELPIVLQPEDMVAPEGAKLETGDNALKLEKKALVLTPEHKKQALDAFDKYDADGSDSIDREELKKLLSETLGQKLSAKIIERYVEAQFQLGDADGSGTIDRGEFIELYAKLFLGQSTIVGAAVPPIL